ncbi:hypothetical protein DFH11DRAFT_576752 [Phellopilus nigrolimitatus]|nr:hypothetical protein DFH11DRAFT_576752 [Phellopilus nigrolimitatus]
MATVLTTAAAAGKAKQHSYLDWLKPRRGAAIAKLKNNGFAMLVALLVTQLSPITPSPLTCLWMLVSGGKGMSSGLRLVCWIELAIFAFLSANIFQGYIGLKYPPPPCEPLGSPAKRAQLHSPPAARPLKTFTPVSTPLKASSFASSYAPSPVSTPSRIINYKSPLPSSTSTSPFYNSLNSSTLSASSLMSSPLAYRARQSQPQPVRSLDGSLLSRLETDDDDDY